MNAFASYSRKDASLVGPIVAGLEGLGHSVWFDTDDIRGGDQWRQAIITGITSSQKLLLFLSPNSVASANVQREVTVADEHHLRIIPVLLAPCDVPAALQYSLAGVHWIDASSQSTGDAVIEIDGVLSAADSSEVVSLPTDPQPDSAAPRTDPPPREPTIDGHAADGATRSGRSKRLAAAAAAAVGLLVVVAGLTRCGSDSEPPSDAAAGDISVSSSTDASNQPEETASEPLASAQSATTATVNEADEAPDAPVIAAVTTADGRSTTFGGMTYEIESVRISNGVDSSGRPMFTGTPTGIGERTVVRVDTILRNDTDGVLFYVGTPMLRLAGDPVANEGNVAEYGSLSFDAGGGGRIAYEFVLRGASADPAILQGATLLFTARNALSDGIPLDGEPHEPLLATPIPVGAAAFFDGDAAGTITVNSVEPALEARGWLGSGADEPADYRMPNGEIWLLMDLTFDCVGPYSGQASCYFGNEQAGFRVEVDGVAEGFETVEDWSIADAIIGLLPGSSARETVMMRVPVGETYTLLLGDPADPATVQRTPLELKAAVSALYESVAPFQQ